MNPTRWLVAHDFSKHGERAAEVAAADLERLGGELHIVHVYSVPTVPLSYEWGSVDAIYASSHDLETAQLNLMYHSHYCITTMRTPRNTERCCVKLIRTITDEIIACC